MQKKPPFQKIKHYLKGGLRIKSDTMTLLYHKNKHTKMCVVIISKKNIKNAVKRNYVRRATRFLIQNDQNLKGIFIFIYKSNNIKFEDIKTSVYKTLSLLKNKTEQHSI